ncbi:MAG: AAA family ATPase, partial [Anaerolineales bacterium]|nr:AAA family ATPase [Anaerolineales bacterium]
QMATLQAGLDKAQSQAEALDRELESLQDDLLASEEEAAELQSAMQDNRSRIEALWTAQRQAQLEVDKVQNMRRLQVEQKTQLEVESGRLHDVLAQASAELEALESEANAAQQDVQALNAQLSADTLQEFHAQVNHWNATLMVLQRASSDARSRLSERQAAYQKTSELLAGAQSHREEAQAACRELEARMVELKNAEAEVSQEIAQLNQVIAPAEEALRGVENELLDFQEKEVAVRGQISAAEGLATQARIGQTRQQERLEALQRRIEDDFGLVAFEYSEEVSGRTPLPLSGLVERLPRVENISGELEGMIAQAKATLRRMGAINMEAKAEYEEVRQRHAFMTEQISDLEKAEQDIRQVIAELDEIMQQEFRRTFEAVEEEFKTIFTQLFGGGSARLILTDPEDLTGTGIDIEARLPGKRLQGLSLLSGGERSLTATALIFALLRVSPTPFCVLDEVDAMLDEANVGRFSELLRELSQKTQFIIVTHNRNTVQVADVLYGVTMGRDSTSQVISLKLDDLDKVLRN